MLPGSEQPVRRGAGGRIRRPGPAAAARGHLDRAARTGSARASQGNAAQMRALLQAWVTGDAPAPSATALAVEAR